MIPRRVHLVGIGGIGLSGIARILQARGHQVSGSDLADTPLLAELERTGMDVYRGHAANQVGDAEMVIISSAIPARNPELQEARRRGLPVLRRAQVLPELIGPRRTVAVAGTHGKTTTSSMIALTLLAAGTDPSFIVGGIVQGLGTNARHGEGDLFVIEADEYDRTFLGLRPEVAVVTHLEWDHPDCYPTPGTMREAFHQFVQQVQPGGCLIVCADHAGTSALVEALPAGVEGIRYGLSPGADLQAVDVTPREDGTCFQARSSGRSLGQFALQVPGLHNVRNALATLAVAGHLGIPEGQTRQALARFGGVERRFQVKGTQGDVVVVDDYAHHPTEIEATLEAARQAYPGRKVWAIFQPHTFSRTDALEEEFARSLAHADAVVILPVYPAREEGDPVAASQRLARQIPGDYVNFAPSLEEAARQVLQEAQPGDVVLTLGAGDGYRVGEMILRGFERSAPAPRATTGAKEGRWQSLAAELAGLGLSPRPGEPLGRHTSFRIGGPADLWVAVASEDRLVEVVQKAREADVPVTVLGGGTNVLVADRGVRGLVIGYRSRGAGPVRSPDAVGLAYRVPCGASLSALGRWAVDHGLAGLEWAVGIPGSVGGAVLGNAGAYGGCMADVLRRVQVLEGSHRRWMEREALGLGYRTSALKQKEATDRPILLAAEIRLEEGAVEDLRERVGAWQAQRRAIQPREPSAGSVFRNPAEAPAGQLIEEAGLKGHRVGDAVISEKHANFIVNAGSARAEEVWALICEVRDRIQGRFGILLELEIERVGEWE